MNVGRAFGCVTALGLVALVSAACEWQAEPASASLTLAGKGCSDDDEAVLGHRIPCDESFEATASGTCVSSGDGGCVTSGKLAQCECHARGILCLDDAGTRCNYRGECCACDEGAPNYLCECESDGDNCGCRQAPDAVAYAAECR